MNMDRILSIVTSMNMNTPYIREHEDEMDEIEKIEEQWSHRRSDWAVIAGLLALLTFSPCKAFLPVFLIGAKYRLVRFCTCQFRTLAVATVAGIVVFTWLTLLGLQRLRLKFLENYEPLVVGGVFCALGLIIILFEQ